MMIPSPSWGRVRVGGINATELDTHRGRPLRSRKRQRRPARSANSQSSGSPEEPVTRAQERTPLTPRRPGLRSPGGGRANIRAARYASCWPAPEKCTPDEVQRLSGGCPN